MVQPLWKIVLLFLKKTNIELLYDPAVPHLGIYPEVQKAGSQRDLYTPTFFAALFTTASRWKQSKCPSVDEWLNKMWSRHTMECQP